ncbi:MAG: flippase-like domain-containing protein [Ignavibacteriales bacterium]|nr:flippase-like domain-containing protein [Ignavibacteriales bacterium]
MKILLPFTLMGVFLYFAFVNVDFQMTLELISHTSFFWLIIFLITFFISHLIRAIRWKIIINSVKPHASLINLFGALMVGYGVNNVIPRLGEVYRAAFIGRWEGLSRTSMFGAVILERVIDIISLLICVFIAVFIYSGNLYQDVPWLTTAIYIVGVFIIVALLLIILLVKFKEKFYNTIVKFTGKFSTRIANKLSYVFGMLLEGFSSLKSFKNYFYTIILSVLIMLIYALNAYFGFFMLQMSPVDFSMAFILMTIGAFGVVFPTPGGLGSYHLIVISVLVHLFNFSNEVGSAYALLTHSIGYITFIISMFVMLYIINRRQFKLGAKKENFFSVFKLKADEK